MDLKYEMKLANPKGSNPAIVEVRIAVGKDGPSAAIAQANSQELKKDVFENRHSLGLSDYGISTGGAPRVEVTTDSEGTRTPVAYIREFKFTRAV